MKIEVYVTDIGVTQSAAEDGMSKSELASWVAEQELKGGRYIVFPTTAQMLRWRSLVLGISP